MQIRYAGKPTRSLPKVVFMKPGLIGFLFGALVAYAIGAFVGAAAAPAPGTSITTTEAAAALAFSFPDAGSEPASWFSPSGNASQGWLIRRAYVTGRLWSETGTVYSEHVLKVGWPFTVVRGFIRMVGSETSQEGAGGIPPAPGATSARMLPTQPVWPGLIFYGLVGGLGFAALSRRTSQHT